jgi:hypothetical protein
MYDIPHCFICRPSDFTVSEDTEIEPRTVATTSLVRRSNHSARSHPLIKVVNFSFCIKYFLDFGSYKPRDTRTVINLTSIERIYVQ